MSWAPSYAEAEELTAFARIRDDLDDAQAGLALAAASRAIDRCTRRQFGAVAVAEARSYTAWWDCTRERWIVPVDDFQTTAGMSVAFDLDGDETFDAPLTDYSLRPANAAKAGRPWEELVILPGSDVALTDADNAVSVVALWGWTEVPDAVKQACLLQASRLLSRRDSPFGVAGSPQMGGGELRLLAKVDPDVEVALRDYKRRTGAVVFA